MDKAGLTSLSLPPSLSLPLFLSLSLTVSLSFSLSLSIYVDQLAHEVVLVIPCILLCAHASSRDLSHCVCVCVCAVLEVTERSTPVHPYLRRPGQKAQEA